MICLKNDTNKFRAFSINYVTLYYFCDGMHDFLMSRL